MAYDVVQGTARHTGLARTTGVVEVETHTEVLQALGTNEVQGQGTTVADRSKAPVWYTAAAALAIEVSATTNQGHVALAEAVERPPEQEVEEQQAWLGVVGTWDEVGMPLGWVERMPVAGTIDAAAVGSGPEAYAAGGRDCASRTPQSTVATQTQARAESHTE